MRILLDENCPLALYHRLRGAGVAVEHIIVLGQRGLPDREIRARLAREELVFLTQDTEFEDVPPGLTSRVIISRVPQGLPIAQRVETWVGALQAFVADPPPGRLFELLASGRIIALDARRRS